MPFFAHVTYNYFLIGGGLYALFRVVKSVIIQNRAQYQGALYYSAKNAITGIAAYVAYKATSNKCISASIYPLFV